MTEVSEKKPERCDFCNTKGEAPWTYVTPNLASSPEEATRLQVTWFVDERWAACEECHDLIKAGNAEGLLKRSIETQDMVLLGGDDEFFQSLMEKVWKEVAGIHEAFWRYHVGEPYYQTD